MVAGFQEALLLKRKIKTRFDSITQLKKITLIAWGGGGGTLKHLHVTFNAYLHALYWPCMKECYCWRKGHHMFAHKEQFSKAVISTYTPPMAVYLCTPDIQRSHPAVYTPIQCICAPHTVQSPGSLHPDSASVHPSAVYLQPLGSIFMSLRQGIHSPPAGIYSSVYPLWLLHSIFPSTHLCICTPWQCVHSIPSRVSHSPHQSWTHYLSFGLSLSFSTNLCFVHILWTQALVWQIYPFLWCVF